MKLVIFGLTISSSWGNGHATLWRGLCRGLAERDHGVVFYERDVPYYAMNRDLWELPGGQLRLYADWEEIAGEARRALDQADVGIVTSYCPDALNAAELLADSPVPVRAFYDLDTPVTLDTLRTGRQVPYIGPRGLGEYNLVLSYSGGSALEELRTRLGARNVAPLYNHADPRVHKPTDPTEHYACDLSYLGTYSKDRQQTLETLFVEPARRLPARRFMIGGAQYPDDFPWASNIFFRQHLPPDLHPAFFCSSRLTLNVTRRAMVEMGYGPSGRLFEAAACGVPVLSDAWEGLDTFFAPGEEILLASTVEEAMEAVSSSDAALRRIGEAARARVLRDHTSARRAEELERLCEAVIGSALDESPHRAAG